MTNKILLFFLLIGLACWVSYPSISKAHPKVCKKESSCSTCNCNGTEVKKCRDECVAISTDETGSPDNPATTMGHITEEFSKHRMWMERLFFGDPAAGNRPGLLAAMQLMTAQLSASAMQQVNAIGMFFDAKHQLETQRLFQTLTARAHKDYHPSEELCEVGTLSKSLLGSAQNTAKTSSIISRQLLDRQVLAKGNIAYNGTDSDSRNRLTNFIKTYCDKSDNNGNLDLLCKKGNPDRINVNKDINYTNTIGSPLTLDMDFTDGEDNTADENAAIALSQNLFSHRLFPFKSANVFVKADGTPSLTGAGHTYLNARSVIAKKNVAANSFSSIAALKAKGSPESSPFIYALLKEMGGTELTGAAIKQEIGENPSYYAQMEVLTKKLYQRPEFYSDLYDKPANVMRKNVAIQAATLMQKRDLYQSYLRSEMALAVMLETLLIKEQNILESKMEGNQ